MDLIREVVRKWTKSQKSEAGCTRKFFGDTLWWIWHNHLRVTELLEGPIEVASWMDTDRKRNLKPEANSQSQISNQYEAW